MTGWAALLRQGQAALAEEAAAWADPQAAQTRALQRLLGLTADTAFGRAHGLGPGMSLADWQAAVPIRDPAGFQPWTQRIADGEAGVLTTDPVLAFELTGGSAGGRRAVPYTPALLDDFRWPVLAWLGDLLATHPAIALGRAYFAVSPALTRPVSHLGQVPVGLGSDLAYFGPDMAAHLAPLLIWHSALAAAADEGTWAQATALHLAAAADLTLISVWSPTFLSHLLDRLATDPDLPRLLHDGAHGLPGTPACAAALTRARRAGLDLSILWPRLTLVSAWGDAASARPAADLRARLGGGVVFQAKGLLATEGVFTLPVSAHPHPMPALTGPLLEFEDEGGALHPAHDLTPGQTYALIVSTAGGLQRYRMGDLVTAMPGAAGVTGLRFAGRAAACDLVGEKLTEAFVLTCLDGLPAGALLAPDAARYDLWVDAGDAARLPPDSLTLLDARLRHNPQYDYARRLGQLAAPRLRPCIGLAARYIAHRLALGHRLSDIKPPALLPHGPLHPVTWAADPPGKD